MESNGYSNNKVDTYGGPSIIGDSNVVNILKESADHIKLKSSIEGLKARLVQIQERVEKYPDDKDFPQEALKVSAEINEKEQELEWLKHEVVKLAEVFNKIEINTDRLKIAKEHFEKGEFKEARAVLDAEKMTTELDALLVLKDKLKGDTKENNQFLRSSANEFLILARLTAVNFDLPGRFDKAMGYFESSLKADRNRENMFAYAYFLQSHNQFIEALPIYEQVLEVERSLLKNDKAYLPNVAMTLNNLGNLQWGMNNLEPASASYNKALEIYRSLAETTSKTYTPYVATTLNNLGVLQNEMTDQVSASESLNEALEIRRVLAVDNPQTYLADVAMTLNNLGVLQIDMTDQVSASASYNEALEIRRVLADYNPQMYLPYLATTLNNLGVLQRRMTDSVSASVSYNEALEIRRVLADRNPQKYLPDVALTLNNLGVLQNIMNDKDSACTSFNEALDIYRTLAKTNPQTYLPDLAMTTGNLANFSFSELDDAKKALIYAKESVISSIPFTDTLPRVKDYVSGMMKVAESCGVDPEVFWKECVEEYNKQVKGDA